MGGNSKLSDNATSVAENRYFMDGETWQDCADRVGSEAGRAENGNSKSYSEKFSEMIYEMDFLPGGRILRNTRRARGSLFNCYVLPIGDSIEEIGQFMKDALILWSEGGGVGCNFSYLRPRGTAIKGKGGTSSGPVSFLESSDALANTIESGGSRRAAALACMHVSHPDILEFIDVKLTHGKLSHYNISVAVDGAFLEAVESNKDWQFKFAQQNYGTIDAREIWDKIIENMVNCAEPGLLNWRNLQSNNSYYFDPILSTNPSLRKGTKILTNNGVIPIEELQDRNFKVPNIRNSYSDATCFLSGNNKNLYKITLQGGYEYFATAEHKWPVVIKDKWNYTLNDFNKKRTDELQEGDYLPQPNKKTSLKYGDIGDYDDGFLIGWNIGDGWISNNDRPNQIGFIVSEEDQKYGVHDILTKKLRRLGWTGEFKDRNNNKETNIQNKRLINFFETFGVTKKEFGIPKAIWNIANEEFRKGFIDGLFSSDGSVDSRILLISSRKKLVYDVAELLGFYGIQSSIKYTAQKGVTFPNGKTYDKTYHKYTLTISRQSSILHFYETFKLTHGRKQNILNERIKKFKLIPAMNVVKIISVERTNLFEDVWDITVHDEEHCFELSQVISGNCGEVPLGSYGVCDLGSIVLSNFVKGRTTTNWKKMEYVIKLAVRFLDNIIDINKYVLKEIDINAHNGRRIGIGVMGLAEYLFAKKLRYGSKEAVYEIEKLMRFIRDTVYEASIELAIEKGAFPKFDSVNYSKAHFVRSLPAATRMSIKKHGIRNVSLMAVAPTGCLVDDTLIPSNRGCIKIIDYNNINNTHPIKLSSDFGNSHFKNFFDQGVADTVMITTTKGYNIEGTFDHKVRVITDGNGYIWKKLEEITSNDYVVLKKDFLFDKNTWVRPDVAELLGFYTADGWWTVDGDYSRRLYFKIHMDEEEYVVNLLKKCFYNTFHINPIVRDSEGNSKFIEVNSKKLYDWFNEYNLIKKGAENAFIPDIIMKAGKNIILSFIKGFFYGDGGFNVNRESIKFTTVSEKLAFQLHLMLLGVGCVSNKRLENTKGNSNILNDRIITSNYDTYRIELSTYYSRLLCRLMNVEDSFINNKYKGRNFEHVLVFPDEERLFNEVYKIDDREIYYVTRYIYDKKSNVVNWFVDNNLIMDNVKTIEKCGKKHVSDIEVNENTHTYVANGFITHNTISLLPEATSGIEPLFRKAYIRSDQISDRMYVHPLYEEALINNKENEIKDWFVDTDDLKPADHFETQSIIQKYVDGALSKTINLPKGTTTEELSALTLEYIYDLKGVTVYVDESREGQILNKVSVSDVKKHLKEKKETSKDMEILNCAAGSCDI